VTRFWLGGSVARRLPGHATTTEAGRAIPAEATKLSLLAGRVRTGNPAEFSKKETQSVFTLLVRNSRKRIFCFRSTDAQNPKIDGKAIAASQ
jgi:hypothetical protein